MLVHRPKKILLLGATGRTGKEVLKEALEHGCKVNVLVRDAQQIHDQHRDLRVFEGDTRVPADLRKSIAGCEAVISCLNISRKNDFPWAPLRTPEYFLSMTMKSLIAVCKEEGVKRLIFTSAWGVGDSRPHIPGWFAWIIDNSNLSAAYLEHERQEALISQSGLDWTVIRPVGLTNSKTKKVVNVVLNHEKKPSYTISRRSTASFILASLMDRKYIHTYPVIYS
ncbi:NAD(P)-dependent oxidoreductase [Pararhodonellum marinum]|uniref:NAD(P)-dependent oxidoreductase n=1 Tax=Pararhodonellum marinum TaxID=2755358 RepID=UPI0018908984|nr:NAD(P)H-binding protein [Pararhodonellum marinum]